jgi:kynurenine formamidase
MIIKDLSQTYANGMPKAATIPEPSFSRLMSVERDGISVTQLSVATHVGTHLDAPSHVIAGGKTIDQIPLDTLVGPAVVVSVKKPGGEKITAQDLLDAGANGSPGDALLIHTGWGSKFGTEDYHEHPYLAEDAAQWIVDNQLRLVGVDTITPELPGHLRQPGFDFPIHHILLGSGVLIIEHLFLEEVIGQRFDLFVGSLKIADADGSPTRVLAVFGDENR